MRIWTGCHTRTGLDTRPGATTAPEIAVTVTEEGLTVTGERKREEEKKNHNWYRTERTDGKFVRTVPLPAGDNTAEIKATFQNGILELAVPLPPAAVAAVPRRVEIAEGEPQKAKMAASANAPFFANEPGSPVYPPACSRSMIKSMRDASKAS